MNVFDFTPFKAMIVEDNDFVRFMVKKHMTGFGFSTVLEAANGMDGLEQLKKYEPDIIVCDIHMEPVNGFEFLKCVRNMSGHFAKLPVIFLTSAADEQNVKKAMSLAVDAYLLKPVQPVHLRRKIESLLLQKMSN